MEEIEYFQEQGLESD